jgi:hypothetical protein
MTQYFHRYTSIIFNENTAKYVSPSWVIGIIKAYTHIRQSVIDLAGVWMLQCGTTVLLTS